MFEDMFDPTFVLSAEYVEFMEWIRWKLLDNPGAPFEWVWWMLETWLAVPEKQYPVGMYTADLAEECAQYERVLRNLVGWP